jgi:hypothetical protein
MSAFPRLLRLQLQQPGAGNHWPETELNKNDRHRMPVVAARQK